MLSDISTELASMTASDALNLMDELIENVQGKRRDILILEHASKLLHEACVPQPLTVLPVPEDTASDAP